MAIFIGDPVCAWCSAESGELPGENQSHGICASHVQQVEQEYNEHKAQELLRAFNSTPSYVERFRDGRESW